MKQATVSITPTSGFASHSEHIAGVDPWSKCPLNATNGAMAEVYNGPAAPVWAAIAHKAMPDNGQRQISLARLRQLQEAG